MAEKALVSGVSLTSSEEVIPLDGGDQRGTSTSKAVETRDGQGDRRESWARLKRQDLV